jgi:hypothetical protein
LAKAALPSVLYDAVVLALTEAASSALAKDGRVLEFLRDQYRHDKPFLVLGAGRQLVAAAGIPSALPNGEPDPGLIVADPAGRDASQNLCTGDRSAARVNLVDVSTFPRVAVICQRHRAIGCACSKCGRLVHGYHVARVALGRRRASRTEQYALVYVRGDHRTPEVALPRMLAKHLDEQKSDFHQRRCFGVLAPVMAIAVRALPGHRGANLRRMWLFVVADLS